MMHLAITCCLFLVTLVSSYASEVEPLLQATGSEFKKTLDALAGDTAVVTRLRASPIIGTNRNDLRSELLRRLVLARADAPEVFASFDEMLALIRPDSPMVPAGYWDGLAAYGPPDESVLQSTMHRWLHTPPANTDEWVKVFSEVNPQVSVPDAKRMANRFWPAIAYGLSAEPARMRRWTVYLFTTWCAENHYGEVELEGQLWLCERTSFDSEMVTRYRTAVSMGRDQVQDGDEARFVSRQLTMFEEGEKIITADNKPSITDYLADAEKFGTPAHALVLRRLAEMPVWSVYREVMLDIAKKLESNSTDKSQVVTRGLAIVEGNQYNVTIIGNRIPGILDDAVKYGTAAHAPVLRRLAELPVWSAYRDRMLQVAVKLEKAVEEPNPK